MLARPARPADRARGFVDAARALEKIEATFPASGPFLRLDRVYANARVRPLEIGVHGGGAAPVASDHLPLVCRIEVLGAPAR